MSGAYVRPLLHRSWDATRSTALRTCAEKAGRTPCAHWLPITQEAASWREFAVWTVHAREADKAARKAIREQKKQERKEDFQTRVDALKAKFHKDQ
jgi:hypothetical protein